MAEGSKLFLKLLLLLPAWGWLVWLGACVEPGKLVVEHISAELPGWPAGAAPVRVALVGDIHATKWDGERVDRLVQAVLETDPEAVILLGDYLFTTGKHRFSMEPQEFATRLAPLVQHCPVYFVLGNHDYFPETMRIRRDLKKAGLTPLSDRRDHVHVFTNGQGVLLRGAPFIPEKEDAARLQPRFAPENGGRLHRPLITVSHNPYHFLKWKLAGDLVLSGHTHGGQICLKRQRPFLPFGTIPPAWQKGGWHTAANGAPLYITRGTGMTKLLLRFNCPPEITVLQLRGKPE